MSGLSLQEFCRREKIPYRTACDHVEISKREEYLGDSRIDAQLRKILDNAKNRYTASYDASYLLLSEMAAEASRLFQLCTTANSPKGAFGMGRIAKEAMADLRQVCREMEQMPAPGEDAAVWPVTKDFWPLTSQRDFIFDLPSNTKGTEYPDGAHIFAYVGGIGAGKTRAGAEKLGKLCELNRGSTLGAFAPTYRMLEDVTMKTFLEVCVNKGIPFERRKSDKAVVLWGDTTVLFRSMTEPDKIRGLNLSAAWLDEVAQLSSDEAFRVIQGRIRDQEAKELCIIITTTPNGFNWLYRVLVKNKQQNRVIEYKALTEDNLHLPENFPEQAKRVYDAKYAAQELYAEWVDVFTGRAYYNFSRKTHELLAAKCDRMYDPNRPLLLMCDFNVSPMAWEVGQSFRMAESGEEVTYVFDELYIDTTSTEETAREFLSRWGKHTAGVNIYGDAAGRHRHTSATRTDYQIIEDVFKAKKLPGVKINVGRSNPLHEERVKDVNARLRDANGVIHLYVSAKCEHLIEDLERVGFKAGTRQLDKSDPLVGHSSDGLGYYCNREHAIRRMKVSHSGARAA